MDEAHRAITAVFRIESAKLIAGLARMVRDVGLAEELAQDALVSALERWPLAGIPENILTRGPAARFRGRTSAQAVDRPASDRNFR